MKLELTPLAGIFRLTFGAPMPTLCRECGGSRRCAECGGSGSVWQQSGGRRCGDGGPYEPVDEQVECIECRGERVCGRCRDYPTPGHEDSCECAECEATR